MLTAISLVSIFNGSLVLRVHWLLFLSTAYCSRGYFKQDCCGLIWSRKFSIRTFRVIWSMQERIESYWKKKRPLLCSRTLLDHHIQQNLVSPRSKYVTEQDMNLIVQDPDDHHRRHEMRLNLQVCLSEVSPKLDVVSSYLDTLKKLVICESLWLTASVTRSAWFFISCIRLETEILMILICLKIKWRCWNLARIS